MTAYLIIGGLGLVVLLASLLVGDLLDGLFDFDAPFLSTSALAAFCSAFGFAGALTLNAGAPAAASVLAGVAGGVLLGAVAGYTTRALRDSPSAASPSMSSVVDAEGVVIVEVGDSMGTVSVTIGSHTNRYSAYSSVPGTTLAVGTPVRVVSALSPTLVAVRPHHQA